MFSGLDELAHYYTQSSITNGFREIKNGRQYGHHILKSAVTSLLLGPDP